LPFSGVQLSESPCGQDYLHFQRVEAARRQIERTDKGLKQVASTTGFGSVDVMRRAFVRLLGITPRRYRELAEQ
jgi:transcriptional regulator GlxA family with amidase domain